MTNARMLLLIASRDSLCCCISLHKQKEKFQLELIPEYNNVTLPEIITNFYLDIYY